MRSLKGSRKSPRKEPKPKRVGPPSRAVPPRRHPTTNRKNADSRRIALLALIGAIGLAIGGVGIASATAAASSCSLVVATYDSIAGPRGWGSAIVSRFNRSHPECPARLVADGDAVRILNRVALEKARSKRVTHVVLGIDNFTWDRLASEADAWGDWRPSGFASIPPSLRMRPGFLPFDWSPFAIMVDRDRLRGGAAPRTLRELSNPKWKGLLLAEDPRTSTPGVGLLEAVSRAAGGEARFESFWSALRPSILALMPGWDQAYGAFLQGEAPLVWSYLTSQAYHRMHDDRQGRYFAVVPEDAEVVQVEGAAILRDAVKDPAVSAASRSFLEFVISKEAQELLPQTQWMFPVREGTTLPAAFRELGFDPARGRNIAFPDARAQRDRMARWERTMRGGSGR